MLSEPRYDRRAFLALAGTGAGVYTWWSRTSQDLSRPAPSQVRVVCFDNHGTRVGVAELKPIRKSDAEWRKQLQPDAYSVTRRQDTEFAGTGQYDHFYEEGVYRCICCGTALFDSKSKYASGTGWPSFTQPIAPENVVESPSASFGIRETEVRCALCNAHLGHVFDDGPPPANLRYCINSVALVFVPAA
jgi:peptide-methionine (R)-S-oxide reductase